MIDVDPQDLAARYIALWIEPDEQARRTAIGALWAADGAHILRPPVEIVKAAAELGFESPTLEAHGHAAIETRVSRSYETFVATGANTFRPTGDAIRLGNVVKFSWEMVADEVVAGGGVEVLVLGGDGTIKRDNMFPG